MQGFATKVNTSVKQSTSAMGQDMKNFATKVNTKVKENKITQDMQGFATKVNTKVKENTSAMGQDMKNFATKVNTKVKENKITQDMQGFATKVNTSVKQSTNAMGQDVKNFATKVNTKVKENQTLDKMGQDMKKFATKIEQNAQGFASSIKTNLPPGMGGASPNGVGNMNGSNFTIDDEHEGATIEFFDASSSDEQSKEKGEDLPPTSSELFPTETPSPLPETSSGRKLSEDDELL